MGQHPLPRQRGQQSSNNVEASENAGEVYEVLWEIGLHLVGFLVLGLVVNLLLALFGVA
jgi:hypothetical protein